MRSGSRLMAGLFSILMVISIIAIPPYLVNKLQTIEVSGNYYAKYDEVVNSTTITYTPYIEHNESTGFNYDEDIYFNNGTQTIPDRFYNVEDYTDMVIGVGNGNSINLYVSIKVDFEDLLSKNINVLSIVMNSSYNYKFWQMKVGAVGVGDLTITVPSEWNVYDSGVRTFYMEFTEQQLIDYATYQDPVSVPDRYLVIKGVFSDLEPSPFYIDVQIGPEYYQESESENTSSLTYEQADLSFSTFDLRRIVFGIGAILIFIIGLIASPLPIGEAFDGIFPINNHPQPKRRRKN